MIKNWYHLKFSHGKDMHTSFIEVEVEDEDELEDVADTITGAMADIYEDVTGMEPIQDILSIQSITLIHSRICPSTTK